MPVIGCLEIFQNGRSPQPITGIIYSPGPHELKIGSAVEDTLGFIPLVLCLKSTTCIPAKINCAGYLTRLFQSAGMVLTLGTIAMMDGKWTRVAQWGTPFTRVSRLWWNRRDRRTTAFFHSARSSKDVIIAFSDITHTLPHSLFYAPKLLLLLRYLFSGNCFR